MGKELSIVPGSQEFVGRRASEKSPSKEPTLSVVIKLQDRATRQNRASAQAHKLGDIRLVSPKGLHAVKVAQ